MKVTNKRKLLLVIALAAVIIASTAAAAILLWSGKVGEMTMVVQAPAVTVKEAVLDLGALDSYTTYEFWGYGVDGWIDVEHLGSAKIVVTVLNGTGIDYFDVYVIVSNETNKPVTFLNTTGWILTLWDSINKVAEYAIELNSTHNTAVIEVTGGNMTITIENPIVSTGIVPQNTTTSLVVQVEVLPGTKKPVVEVIKTP